MPGLFLSGLEASDRLSIRVKQREKVSEWADSNCGTGGVGGPRPRQPLKQYFWSSLGVWYWDAR